MSIIKKEQLPLEYQVLWDELIMPVDTDITFERVILSEENTEKYKALMKEQFYREKLFEYGLMPMNRILLYGASGTGKTFSLKALSNKLQYTLIYVDIAKSLTEGNVSQNIANIFKLGNYIADRYEGCIIFLDECDSIAWNRDTGTSESGAIRRATNSIFQHLDQMSPNAIFASATNMLHRLDAAFERRFNLKLEFRRPELDIDDTIRHFMLNKFELVDDVDVNVREVVKKRAKQYVKLSYYELQVLVERAMKDAILNDTIQVKTSYIYNLLADNMNFKIRFGTANDEDEMFSNKETYDPRYNRNIPKQL